MTVIDYIFNLRGWYMQMFNSERSGLTSGLPWPRRRHHRRRRILAGLKAAHRRRRRRRRHPFFRRFLL